MESMHWGYFVPLGAVLLAGIYLSAVVDSSRAENTTTPRLRLMFLVFGLGFLYLGILAWFFDLNLSRFGSDSGRLGAIVFTFVGVILLLMAAFRSRKGLVKDSDYLTKPPYDIELGGKPEITPAERIDKLREKD